MGVRWCVSQRGVWLVTKLLMSERQLTFRANEVALLTNTAYKSFRDGQFHQAVELLERALELDVEDGAVAGALKCAGFWREREARLSELAGPFERAEYLVGQWKLFKAFAARLGDIPEKCVYDIKLYVFGTALDGYLQLKRESTDDPDLLVRIGRCYKAIGDYEQAIAHLELASRLKRDAAWLLAELADCYALVNEDRYARIFFREAFFLDPRSIDLDMLESPIMVRLRQRVQTSGRPPEHLKEWLPVLATTLGVFNVKRELKPLELGRLKQAIHSLEKEYESGNIEVVPTLINRYFWLIDHYTTAGEDRSKIDEVLVKLKSLDPEIYREYVN